MIVVTGAPRTGTTATMRSLVASGFDVPDGLEERTLERPNFRQPPEQYNFAAKIFGQWLPRFPRENIDKVIVCVRDPEDAIRSMLGWLGTSRMCAFYIAHYQNVRRFLEETDLPRIVVDFDEWVADDERVATRLTEFLAWTVQSEWDHTKNKSRPVDDAKFERIFKDRDRLSEVEEEVRLLKEMEYDPA